MAENKYEELRDAFKRGFEHSTRAELQRYATIVCLPGMAGHFPATQWPQIAEMVRLMLLVRISEDTQNEGLKTAREAAVTSARAVRVAKFAAWLVVIQILLAVPPTVALLQQW